MTDADRLRSWLERVHRRWTELGVPAGEQHELGRDLAADIEAALADGVPVDEFVRLDPVQFADAVADRPDVPGVSRSQRMRQWSPQNVALVGLLGAALSMLVLLLTYYPLMVNVIDVVATTSADWLIVPVHGVAGLLTCLGSLAVLRRWFGPAEATPRALAWVGSGLVAGGLLAILPVHLFARALDYPTSISVVAVEVALVAGFLMFGMTTGARLLNRR